MLRERESKDSCYGLLGVHVRSPYQTPSQNYCEAQAKAKAKDRQGMVTKRSLKAIRLQPLLELTLKLVATTI